MYLSTMYLSHHSKTVISADEKVAELIGQGDKLDAQLAAEREKVRVLRSACEWAKERTTPFRTTSDEVWGSIPLTPIERALTATEETK